MGYTVYFLHYITFTLLPLRVVGAADRRVWLLYVVVGDMRSIECPSSCVVLLFCVKHVACCMLFGYVAAGQSVTQDTYSGNCCKFASCVHVVFQITGNLIVVFTATYDEVRFWQTFPPVIVRSANCCSHPSVSNSDTVGLTRRRVFSVHIFLWKELFMLLFWFSVQLPAFLHVCRPNGTWCFLELARMCWFG